MSLPPGLRVDVYEIVSLIGAGGMGQVYRARDTQLGRDVALKVLPDVFAADTERLARFEREARTLAALNHANIAHVYGLASVKTPAVARASVALVMELVEGDDLSAHIARGAMPLTEALPVASQLADALEAAHEQAIVHRDLKPANIKVRRDGVVKVLDFGLAKAVEPASATSADAMQSPTMTAGATAMGMILGTAAYMAPEQAKGRAVDRRADIWAFGVVLYEMLTGRRAFPGDDITETLAAVIRDTPDFAALPAGTPHRLRQLLERCLVRDPKLRLRDIGEARIELAAIAASAPGADHRVAAPAAPAPERRFPWLAAGLLVVGAVLGAIAWQLAGSRGPSTGGSPASARFELTLPAGTFLAADTNGSVSFSPDGRTLAFVAQNGPAPQLWLRALDSTNLKALPGTENPTQPFWSPDGQHIGFFASGKLKQIDLRTNVVTTLCEAVDPGGGTWNPEGVIVFSPQIEGPLFRISAGGGAPIQLTTLDNAELESNHMWPHFLPDGRHYLFQVLGLNNRGLYAGTVDGSARTKVVAQDGFDMTAVQYSSSGHIVYVRNHQLVARPFDAERLAVTGDEVALADGFGIGGPGQPRFGVSPTGHLAYRPMADGDVYQLTWFSRSGVRQGPLGAPSPSAFLDLSPDGRTVAYTQQTEKETSLWLLDTVRGTTQRFTSEWYSMSAVWFPDGERLAYSSVRDTPPNPFVRTLAGAETRVARLPAAVTITSVTPDGQTLVGDAQAAATDHDLWMFPTTAGASPSVFLQTPFRERVPRVSPDGKWVTFTSNESGAVEVYVTTFPKASRRYRLSNDGGTVPRWSQDGREILFRARSRLMASSFGTSSNGEPALGTPRELFQLPEGAGAWVVADNGQRFLVSVLVTPRQTSPMTVLLNWPAMVKGK